MVLFQNSDCVYARKRVVESVEKRDKNVKRAKSKEKNMCMEKKETKMKSKEKNMCMRE
jgi:hypothetical protein